MELGVHKTNQNSFSFSRRAYKAVVAAAARMEIAVVGAVEHVEAVERILAGVAVHLWIRGM